MADPEGLEPPAPWFEAKCSIQLSYGSTGFSLSENPIFGVSGGETNTRGRRLLSAEGFRAARKPDFRT